MYTVWGQIDQLCLRQQRLLRLVVLVNMLQQTALTAQDLHIVYKKYSGLKKHLAQIFNDQSKLRLSQQSTLRRRWNKGQYEPI